MDFNQSWVIDATWNPSFGWWGQRSIKVKGHMRSSYKIDWKCEIVSVKSDLNQTWFIDMWTFICLRSQRPCTKVKGHLRSSCKMLKMWEKFKSDLNQTCWYNMETFICLCGIRSQIKVKGHLKWTCKITWSKFGLICILEDQLDLP